MRQTSAAKDSPPQLPGEFGLMAFPVSAAARLPPVMCPALCGDGLLLPFTAFSYGDGAEGIRTPDLISAIDARSQLRYSPVHASALTSIRGWGAMSSLAKPRPRRKGLFDILNHRCQN